jgi:hypothetical protein
MSTPTQESLQNTQHTLTLLRESLLDAQTQNNIPTLQQTAQLYINRLYKENLPHLSPPKVSDNPGSISRLQAYLGSVVKSDVDNENKDVLKDKRPQEAKPQPLNYQALLNNQAQLSSELKSARKDALSRAEYLHSLFRSEIKRSLTEQNLPTEHIERFINDRSDYILKTADYTALQHEGESPELQVATMWEYLHQNGDRGLRTLVTRRVSDDEKLAIGQKAKAELPAETSKAYKKALSETFDRNGLEDTITATLSGAMSYSQSREVAHLTLNTIEAHNFINGGVPGYQEIKQSLLSTYKVMGIRADVLESIESIRGMPSALQVYAERHLLVDAPPTISTPPHPGSGPDVAALTQAAGNKTVTDLLLKLNGGGKIPPLPPPPSPKNLLSSIKIKLASYFKNISSTLGGWFRQNLPRFTQALGSIYRSVASPALNWLKGGLGKLMGKGLGLLKSGLGQLGKSLTSGALKALGAKLAALTAAAVASTGFWVVVGILLILVVAIVYFIASPLSTLNQALSEYVPVGAGYGAGVIDGGPGNWSCDYTAGSTVPQPGKQIFSPDGKYAHPMPDTTGMDVCHHWDYTWAVDIYTGHSLDEKVIARNPDAAIEKHMPIVAYVSGTVLWTDANDPPDKQNSLGGLYVILTGDDGRYYYYAHHCVNFVAKGDRVQAGQVIAVSNRTGTNAEVTPEHLHFAIYDPGRPRAPLQSPQGYFIGGGNVCPFTDFREKFGITACHPSNECLPIPITP